MIKLEISKIENFLLSQNKRQLQLYTNLCNHVHFTIIANVIESDCL